MFTETCIYTNKYRVKGANVTKIVKKVVLFSKES